MKSQSLKFKIPKFRICNSYWNLEFAYWNFPYWNLSYWDFAFLFGICFIEFSLIAILQFGNFTIL